jgi:hypothetical protein
MRTLHAVGVAVVVLLLAPILVFGAVLLIPAALLLVLGVPLLGSAGGVTLLAMAPDAERAAGGHGHHDAASSIGYAGS